MAKKQPQNPVSKEDVELFDGLFKRWLEQMNMSDWRIHRLSRPSAEMAEITSQDTNHRLIRYKVGTDFGGTPVTLQSLEEAAIHEALHCRFHEMLEAAYEEGEYNDRVIAAEHSTIIVLTGMLAELVRLKRLVAAAELEGK